ncbi:tRNA (guanosine(46)-N7)-methyltransferase TrmB [Synechocystis salina LEGE 06099]|uniref:tRNA (guanosine(46)-N7)-methyltransferase TrmB n=1 Tax=Synechocystis salina TaxID=945780 RepID=UPI0018819D59|nr:tRNA (guanosine(46)-N7)-methyltransferase TrmB [Synechocystis salina]MBE9204338.1 tRNA (guanosine(46)-N7)-methyltransferase TrmB [Synechocystis salina LEGE 06099]
MARVRIRQHVNPLSHKYRQVLACLDWATVYDNIQRPLHLDIGCARGRFPLKMAQEHPDWNFLGVEIRQPLVLEANETGDRLGLKNLHYLFGNINVEPEKFFSALPPTLQRVSIQFPDPWFKQRHNKRRVAQPELVMAIANALPPGGEVLLQSDVEPVAEDMKERFAENPNFAFTHDTPWLAENPLGVPTEREIACFNLHRSVYRCLLQRIA